jgi:hypothetical protein
MDNSDLKATSLTLVGGASDKKKQDVRKLCADLTAGYKRLTSGTEKSLQPGMLAQWKAGMKNRQTPEYGVPVVVVEFLSTPFPDTKFDSGSIYFREPLDIILGFIDEDGEFSALHYDSRRFEVFEQGDPE